MPTFAGSSEYQNFQLALAGDRKEPFVLEVRSDRLVLPKNSSPDMHAGLRRRMRADDALRHVPTFYN
jgi:hypothetical protein